MKSPPVSMFRCPSLSAEKDAPRPGVLTPVTRSFAARATAFPGENLFELNAGAAGRTSAANLFEYVLRGCGPQRAGGLVLRAEVERTGVRKASPLKLITENGRLAFEV